MPGRVVVAPVRLDDCGQRLLSLGRRSRKAGKEQPDEQGVQFTFHNKTGFNFSSLDSKRQRVKEQKLKPPHTTKTNSVDGAVRVGAVEAIGAPRDGGVVVPIAAAQNTEAPRC